MNSVANNRSTFSKRRGWLLGGLACLLYGAAFAFDAPPTAGRLRLAAAALWGSGEATASNLPVAGSLNATVFIDVNGVERPAYGRTSLAFVDGERRLSIFIAWAEHEEWPTTLIWIEKDREPETLDLNLVGIAPAKPKVFTLSWGPDRRPRIRFGGHQEVEFGPVGFRPQQFSVGAYYARIVLDDVVIRETVP